MERRVIEAAVAASMDALQERPPVEEISGSVGSLHPHMQAIARCLLGVTVFAPVIDLISRPHGQPGNPDGVSSAALLQKDFCNNIGAKRTLAEQRDQMCQLCHSMGATGPSPCASA